MPSPPRKKPRLARFAPFLLAALAAAMLAGCTSGGRAVSESNPFPPACESDAMSGGLQSMWTSWQGVLMLTLLIVIASAGVVYALSGLMNHAGLRIWAKNQVYESIAMLVLAGLLVWIVGFGCGLQADVIGAACTPGSAPSLAVLSVGYYDSEIQWGSCNPYSVALYNLEHFLSLVSAGFWAVIVINMAISAASSTTLALNPNGLGFMVSFGQGFANLGQMFNIAMITISSSQIIIIAQIILLKMFSRLFGPLLVAGVLLRSFGITRGFGGALIALALGFYFIYPMSVVLFYGILQDNIDASVAALYDEDAMSALPTGTPGGSFDLSNWMKGIFDSVMQPVCGFLSLLVLGAVFVPFAVFLVMVSFIRGLSAMLGEEVDVSNITRLI